MTLGQLPASAYLREVLASYGLESLTDWAMSALARGLTDVQVLQEMRTLPEFVQRFPAISLREQQGLAPISPGEYVEYERRVAQLMRDAGLPPSFYDQPEDFTNLLVADKSVAEVSSLVQEGFLRVRMAPPEVREVFADWFGPDGDSALAAFFLDPDRAKPILLRMADEATVAGFGRRFGIDIDQALATEVAETGGTGSAQEAFAALDQSRPLFEETVTETEDLALENEGVRSAFGLGGDAARRVQRRRDQRAAAFGGVAAGGTPGTAEDYTGRR